MRTARYTRPASEAGTISWGERIPKKLSPFDLLNAFTKVIYGKSAYQVVKDVVHGKAPKELPPEDITEEMIFDAVEDVLGPGFFEDPSPPVVPAGNTTGGPEYDGHFYYFDSGVGTEIPRRHTRGRPRSHRVADEYAEWFRLQARRARGERDDSSPTEPSQFEMTREEACKVLGVPLGAPAPVIRQAFRVLAKRWHPDVCPEGPEQGGKMFTRIAIAYKVLIPKPI